MVKKTIEDGKKMNNYKCEKCNHEFNEPDIWINSDGSGIESYCPECKGLYYIDQFTGWKLNEWAREIRKVFGLDE